MTYQRKTIDVYEIYADYGYGLGFEYETGYYTWYVARKELRNYRLNCPEARYKLIKRREHKSRLSDQDLIAIKNTVENEKKQYLDDLRKKKLTATR